MSKIGLYTARMPQGLPVLALLQGEKGEHMRFGLIREEDMTQVKRLWDYCFEKENDPFFQWFFSGYCQRKNVWAGFQQDRLTTCLHLIPYTVFLRGRQLPVSYIVGLAVFPEARGSGVVRELLGTALAEMRRRGHFFSLLMPSKAEFYYPYQWEICYHHYRYRLVIEDLRRLAQSWGDFTLVQGTEDREKLQDVYSRFTADKHGYVVRTPRYWQDLLTEHAAEGGRSVILRYDGHAEGYLLYQLHEDCFLVREMAYTSLAAQRALFRYIYGHRSQVTRLEWLAPVNDPTLFHLPDPKEGVTLFPFMTGRVVDVAGALTQIAYPRQACGQVVLAVDDDLAPWNPR